VRAGKAIRVRWLAAAVAAAAAASAAVALESISITITVDCSADVDSSEAVRKRHSRTVFGFACISTGAARWSMNAIEF
jgi:hypothetical protein